MLGREWILGGGEPREELQVCTHHGAGLCRAGLAAWEGLVPEEAVWLEGEGDVASLRRRPWKTVWGARP